MIIKRNIILIGSMGSGKSHFGRNLAEMKNWQFVDTDRVLEGRFGLPIAEIFKKIGVTFTRKAVEKSIPFGVGVVIGFSANKGLTWYVGTKAKDFFSFTEE